MTIHYRFTDTKGRTHTRTSRRHIEPQFTHGVVTHGFTGARQTYATTASFCGSLFLAEREASARQKHGHVTEICAVEASESRFPEQVERDRATARRVARVKRADLAQLASDEESERRGLAMMSGDLEG